MTARRRSVLAAIAIAGLIAGCGGSESGPTTAETPAPPPTTTATTPTAPPPASTSLALRSVASGLTAPVQTLAVPGQDDLLWVLERRGVIRAIRDGKLQSKPIVDISSRVGSEGSEQGLLSLAFAPDYATSHLVYLHHSDPDGNTMVAEHRVFDGFIDPEPTRTLLTVDQPYVNHNGGSLAFGPDGLLYLGLGDGGSAGDPQGHAQDRSSQLGKLLRADVSGDAQPQWEIAALGLRNPWRFAFDAPTGDAWIADVGQDTVEEVNVFPRGAKVLNFGWNVKEGTRDRAGVPVTAAQRSFTPPVAEYTHDDGCSITGGVVVRNPAIPRLDGRYIYSDLCSGTVWSVAAQGAHTPRKEAITVEQPVSIDASAQGRVFVTSLDGSIQEVVADSGS